MEDVGFACEMCGNTCHMCTCEEEDEIKIDYDVEYFWDHEYTIKDALEKCALSGCSVDCPRPIAAETCHSMEHLESVKDFLKQLGIKYPMQDTIELLEQGYAAIASKARAEALEEAAKLLEKYTHVPSDFLSHKIRLLKTPRSAK